MRKLRTQIAIGKLLRATRKAHKITLNIVFEELKGYEVQCSRSNLGKIEKGKVALRADILAALSNIYNISMEEIMFEKNGK